MMSEQLRQQRTGVLALSDGTVFVGIGAGAVGWVAGEVCFQTAMSGYQEILSDPSYHGQIVTFTFPHIGNVGVNDEDNESSHYACGMVCACPVTVPSNYRSGGSFAAWLESHNIIGVSDVDTRALTHRLREHGCMSAVACHRPEGIDEETVSFVRDKAREHPAMDGLRLDQDVTCASPYGWSEGLWQHTSNGGVAERISSRPLVVVVDYGVKRSVLRALYDGGADVRVVPSSFSCAEVLALKPQGVLLSNGPGDPRSTFPHTKALLDGLLESRVPLLGICLGHQLLALALGARVIKMPFGHHGGNQPVCSLGDGHIDITSQNHGFAVVEAGLPKGLQVTHRSLFDGSVEGLRVRGQQVSSVQYHPEAGPGPVDARFIIRDFVASLGSQGAKASSVSPSGGSPSRGSTSKG